MLDCSGDGSNFSNVHGTYSFLSFLVMTMWLAMVMVLVRMFRIEVLFLSGFHCMCKVIFGYFLQGNSSASKSSFFP